MSDERAAARGRRRATRAPGKKEGRRRALQRRAPEPPTLIERILDAPRLPQIVPRLPADLLHNVIATHGLDACGQILALASREQLTTLVDLDLWRAPRPGANEQLDADRFGEWIDVLVDLDADTAAATVARMDPGVVAVALASYLRVFDLAALTETMIDGEPMAAVRGLDTALRCEVGGFVVIARREEAWDALTAVLLTLDASHHGAFARIMRGCVRLSDSAPEIDGLDNLLATPDQAALDLALGRDDRRDRQGYVSPADARAFLAHARRVALDGSRPAPNPIALACLRIDTGADATAAAHASQENDSHDPGTTPAVADAEVAELVDVLRAATAAATPRALLEGTEPPDRRGPARLRHLMATTGVADPLAFETRTRELAFLANVLTAGCRVQGRAFEPAEAADAAAAICNLGLENWPARWTDDAGTPADETRHPDAFLLHQDLVCVFTVGWTRLHEDISMHTASHLVQVLAGVQSADDDTRSGLERLRRALGRHTRAGTPWHARDALDVMAVLDLPICTALLGLLDECPVVADALVAVDEGATRPINATKYEFVADNRQVTQIHRFVASLSTRLR